MLRPTIALLALLLLSACAQIPVPTLTPAPLPTVVRPPTLAPTTVPSPSVSPSPEDLPLRAPDTALTGVQGAGTATVPLPTLTATATRPPTDTPDTRLKPEQWQDWPVIPAVSARARALYQAGLAAGNNPHAFSKIGDCQNIPSHFLGPFDDPRMYRLGEQFAGLQATLDQFKGMYARESAAVRAGFNVAAVLSPLQADPAVCKPGETPVSCELRLNKPSIALISMETWWAKKPAEEYEKYMRQILDLVIAQKTLPILATKADNLEEDGSINATLAKLAYEYDIPLWNFWKAVQPLPGGGLTEDGFHLSHDSLRPDDPLFYQRLSLPIAWKFGWTVRNVTALQALEAVWRGAAEK